MSQAHDSRVGTYPFESLNVCKLAMEALQIVMTIKWPPEIGPQIRRAAVRVLANLGEGIGRVGAPNDRRRVFRIACGEASEAGLLTEVGNVMAALTTEQHQGLRSRYLRCVYMLTAMSDGNSHF